MSGERNGTKCLLYRFDGDDDVVLVGQLETTIPFNGTPIDISSKSSADFVTLMNSELSTKGRSVSGSLIYNNDVEYQLMRANSLASSIDEYVIDYTGLVADQVRFYGVPSGLSDAAPMGDKVTTSISILSVGEEIQWNLNFAIKPISAK